VAYRFDGQGIATSSSDGTAKVWDAATGQVLITLSGHTGTVTDVAFSRDGKRLATSSNDGTAKVWNISTESAGSGQPLTLHNPSGTQITGVALSPDGQRPAASSDDGTARIYALPLDDILAIAKSRVTRALTTDECRKYLHVEQCPSQP